MPDPAAPATIQAQMQARLLPFLPFAVDSALDVVCADGFTMIVECGPNSLSIPGNAQGSWRAVEVRSLSAFERRLLSYARYDERGQDFGIYHYVPLAVVAEVIASHGGFAPAAQVPA